MDELPFLLLELDHKRKEVAELEEKIQALTKHKEDLTSKDESAEKKKFGVPYRRGKQEKGGLISAGCFEESMWNPNKIMKALGTQPIGHIRTCFPRKNGCPRQGSVCPASQARLDLEFGSNPHGSSDGLEEFSHLWLIFLFHDNGTDWCPRTHVNPPRLNGIRKGVFATRSPHRPNPIGLSLVRLDQVRGRSLYLSGVDLVDGTPILDIKPYIPTYDLPCAISEDGKSDLATEMFTALIRDQTKPTAVLPVRYPSWALPSDDTTLFVSFSEAAEAQLADLQDRGEKPRMMADWAGVREALIQVLQADPRSVYRRQSTNVSAEEFTLYFDCLDVLCSFDQATGRASVRVQALALVALDAQRTSRKAGGCALAGAPR